MMMSRPRPEDKQDVGVTPDTRNAPMPAPSTGTKKIEYLEKRLADLGGPGTSASATATGSQRKVGLSGTAAASGVGKKDALLNRVRAAQERARAAQRKHREQEEEKLKAEHNMEDEEPGDKSVQFEAVPPSYEEVLGGVKTDESQEKQVFQTMGEEELEQESLKFLEELERDAEGSHEAGIYAESESESESESEEEEEEEDICQGEEEEATAPSAPPLHLGEEALGEDGDFSALYQTPKTVATDGNTENTEQGEEKTNPYSLDDLPPSYQEFEQMQRQSTEERDTDDVAAAFEYDAFGNVITSEEQRRVQEEQRVILEDIRRRQECANATSSSMQPTSEAVSRAMSERTTTAPASASSGDTRVVQVGPGHRVAVHDQTKTRDAINAGTALLVECVSCQNWMQIADSASLMFCPCCQSVVPVVRQNTVKSKEEAIRLQRDRRVAEQLQNAEWEEEGTEEGDDGGLTFGSMREFVTSFFSRTNEAEGEDSMRQTSASTAVNLSGTDEESKEEDEGERLLPPARVAERKPHLLSCVVESVSSVATSLGRTLQTSSADEEDEEEAVSFLAVTGAGREGNNSNTEYHRLLDNENETS